LPFIHRDASWAPGSVGEAQRGCSQATSAGTSWAAEIQELRSRLSDGSPVSCGICALSKRDSAAAHHYDLRVRGSALESESRSAFPWGRPALPSAEHQTETRAVFTADRTPLTMCRSRAKVVRFGHQRTVGHTRAPTAALTNSHDTAWRRTRVSLPSVPAAKPVACCGGGLNAQESAGNHGYRAAIAQPKRPATGAFGGISTGA
jgi:hypothetical protein